MTMKDNKAGEHTQGEWVSVSRRERVSDTGFGRYVIYADKDSGPSIANTRNHGSNSFTEEEEEANARLIASAPKMLEALETAQEYIKILTKDLHGESRESKVIASAIKSAKGE